MKTTFWPVAIMLLAFSFGVYAVEHGQWRYYASPNFQTSYTTNQQGERLGSSCFVGMDKCFVTYTTNQHDCTRDYQELDISVMTPYDTRDMKAVCMVQDNGEYMLYLSKTGLMIDMLAGNVAIELTLTGKRPSKFSLYGANESLNYLYDAYAMTEN